MGHKRIDETTVYVHVAENHRREIYEGRLEVARHRRHFEPHRLVVDPKHLEGIYRTRDDAETVASSPIGRSLAEYADCVGGAA